MNRISTDQIDELVMRLETLSIEETEALFDEFAEQQPAYVAYIMQEEFEALGEDEHELLLFNAMTVWYIMRELTGELEPISEEEIDDAQDANWDRVDALPALKKQTFEEHVEPVIALYPQDELLYFILDTMQDDEEAEFNLSKDSKLPIFVAIKTMVDILIKLPLPQ